MLVVILAFAAPTSPTAPTAQTRSTGPLASHAAGGALEWTPLLGGLRVFPIDARRRAARQDRPLLDLVPAGKPTALAFFATYCPPCVEEMTSFRRLTLEGHSVVGISMDVGDVPALAALLDEQDVKYPVAVLADRSMKEVGRRIDGLPLTLILGPEGRVHAELRGLSSYGRLLGALRSASALTSTAAADR